MAKLFTTWYCTGNMPCVIFILAADIHDNMSVITGHHFHGLIL